RAAAMCGCGASDLPPARALLSRAIRPNGRGPEPPRPHQDGLPGRRMKDTAAEQRALKLSIAVTALAGALDIAAGFVIGSRAIMFHGVHSVVDGVPTFGSLAVSKVVTQEPNRRFQYGYWHLEPLLGAVQSALLTITCIYAIINAAQGLIGGGQPMAYGAGVVWTGMMGIVCFAMAAYMNRTARRQVSMLLDVDARAWFVSGFLSLGLMLAYGFAVLLARHGHAKWVPYVDPAVLLVLALLVLRVPLTTLIRAVRDVLEVAPEELDRQVRSVMDALVEERGFLGYSSHVAQIGRGRFVEVHILVPPDYRVETVGAVDAIRREVSERLGAAWPQVWLTVDLTSDPAYL